MTHCWVNIKLLIKVKLVYIWESITSRSTIFSHRNYGQTNKLIPFFFSIECSTLELSLLNTIFLKILKSFHSFTYLLLLLKTQLKIESKKNYILKKLNQQTKLNCKYVTKLEYKKKIYVVLLILNFSSKSVIHHNYVYLCFFFPIYLYAEFFFKMY